MTGKVKSAVAAVMMTVLGACASAPPAPAPHLPASSSPRALTGMEAALHAHVAVLASDRFGGREPMTEGETLTLAYLQDQLVGAGLRSGTHDPNHAWLEPIEYEFRGQNVATYNLIARLPGTEPQSGAVLLMAHWDHLGDGRQCRRSRRDRICNGAVDNASGLAMLIEIARSLAKRPRLRRDVYFLATGGEEAGLRGATAFAQDPPVPLEKFVAAFNLDTEGIAPSGAPVVALSAPAPAGGLALMSLVTATARDEGVTVVAPTAANEKFLRRQDGWIFDAVGVPSVMISAAFADEKRTSDFLARRYHRASDNVAGVELGAAADMVRFHTALIAQAADPVILRPVANDSALVTVEEKFPAIAP